MSQKRTSSNPEKGLLKSENLSSPKPWTTRRGQTSKCALPTYTNEASVRLQATDGDEFTAYDYSSDSSDVREPSTQLLPFKRIIPQPERQRQQQSLISIMVERAEKQESASSKEISDAPPSHAQYTQVACDRCDFPANLSPHTIRHNMLTTELSEPLRRAIVLERRREALKAGTVFDYRHISQSSDVLGQLPNKFCMRTSEDVNAILLNLTKSYYHSRGW